MMDKEHLHLLIHEEIYAIDKTDEPTQMAEPPQPELIKEEIPKKEPEAIHVEKEELAQEYHEETPKIPEVHHEIAPKGEDKPIPLAVFHEASDPAEIELLQKIIDACEIEKAHYQVFANGFNQEVKFEKGLVFVPEAKAFYTPIPYKQSQFLCSKPLSMLAKDVKEKAKLWNALKAFI